MNSSDRDQYVYLVEAKGYHGPLSPLLKRRKIGLTNNPTRRLNELNGSQSPCKITLIKVIRVQDNEMTEAKLHRHFKRNRKHGEWFDFWFWEWLIVDHVYDVHADPTRGIAWVAAIALVVFLLSLTGGLILKNTVHPSYNVYPRIAK